MNYVGLMNEAIDYIEHTLHENTSIDLLSNRFSISKYYFTRIFKALTNCNVKEYITRRKVTEGAKQLLDQDKKIIDVAFDLGYESHEVFTRNFKKVFSITPAELKKTGRPVPFYDRMTIVERDFKNLNRDLVVDYSIEHLNETELYGTHTRFLSDDDNSIAELTPFVEKFVREYIDPNPSIHHMYNLVIPEDANNCYRYFAGYSGGEATPRAELQRITLPESDYAVFTYTNDLSDIHTTVMNDICRTIMISELSFNKVNLEFFLLFNDDFFVTNRHLIYVPVKK